MALTLALAVWSTAEPDGLQLGRRPGPTAFRILYRVEVLQDPSSTTFEERLVRRPFDGRLLGSRSREVDIDDPETSGTESLGSLILSITNGQSVPVQGRVPTVAIGDQALAAVLEDAVRLDRAVALSEDERVLGRPCRLFAVNEPGARVLAAPTADSRATLCLDEAGLVLREVWELDGELVFVRTAVAVDEKPELDALGELGDPAPTDASLAQGPMVRAVTRISSFIAEPPLPRGFRRTGRFQTASVDRALGPLSTSAWVMERGGDFLTVEAGTGSIDQRDAASEVGSTLGDATLHLGTTGSEIRIAVDDDHWVRLTSSVSPSDLERYAAALEARG
ncbi:MAG: hypothetical protein Q8K58_04240 [Acidimicrobiales bacterium]|nr:hypothetical protein [Acidimicrobiales bacterium]